MSGVDRAVIEIELIEKGWVVRKNPFGKDDVFIPPYSLWENMTPIINVYDAMCLQELLKPNENN